MKPNHNIYAGLIEGTDWWIDADEVLHLKRSALPIYAANYGILMGLEDKNHEEMIANDEMVTVDMSE